MQSLPPTVSSVTLATKPSGSERAVVEQDEELVGRQGSTTTDPDEFDDDGPDWVG